jgi:hypothetical protein
VADKKQGAKGSDNSGTRSKREPNKTQADLDRMTNALPQNMRVKVLLPSMKARLMSVPEYERFMAGRNG